MNYSEIISMIKQFMILPEKQEYIVDVLLATALSVELDRPVWIMIVAPPSSGKTELLNILSETKKFHRLYNVTNRFLFSGHPSAGGGYMVREVKKKGIIAFPDFTTVLSMNSKSRNEIFNQLRVMYDGKAGLGTGIDTGKFKAWEGRIALIALVTESIERVKEKSSDLGERFLYYKYIPKELTSDEMHSFTANNEAKQSIPFTVKEFLDQKKNELPKVAISDVERALIFSLSKLVAQGRAVVERSGYSRDIEIVHHPEQPHRINIALTRLYISLVCINGDRKRSKFILKQVAFTSIPDIRLHMMNIIYKTKNKLTDVRSIVSELNFISENKIRRVLQDMEAQKILSSITSNNKISYKLSDDFANLIQQILSS